MSVSDVGEFIHESDGFTDGNKEKTVFRLLA